MVLRIWQRGLPMWLFLWWDFYCRVWYRAVFLIVFMNSILSFSLFLLLCRCLLWNIPIYLRRSFSLSVLTFFQVGDSIPSAISLFPLFIRWFAYFQCQILFLYLGLLFASSHQLFFIFRKYLYVIHLHKMIYLFLLLFLSSHFLSYELHIPMSNSIPISWIIICIKSSVIFYFTQIPLCHSFT